MKRRVVYSRLVRINPSKATSPMETPRKLVRPAASATPLPLGNAGVLGMLVKSPNELQTTSQRVLLKRFTPSLVSQRSASSHKSMESNFLSKPSSRQYLPQSMPLDKRLPLTQTRSQKFRDRRLIDLAASSLRRLKRRRVLKIVDC